VLTMFSSLYFSIKCVVLILWFVEKCSYNFVRVVSTGVSTNWFLSVNEFIDLKYKKKRASLIKYLRCSLTHKHRFIIVDQNWGVFNAFYWCLNVSTKLSQTHKSFKLQSRGDICLKFPKDVLQSFCYDRTG
jgi:hypothetical protein